MMLPYASGNKESSEQKLQDGISIASRPIVVSSLCMHMEILDQSLGIGSASAVLGAKFRLYLLVPRM